MKNEPAADVTPQSRIAAFDALSLAHDQPFDALSLAHGQRRMGWICSFLPPVRLGPPCRRPILIATPLPQSLTWCTRERSEFQRKVKTPQSSWVYYATRGEGVLHGLQFPFFVRVRQGRTLENQAIADGAMAGGSGSRLTTSENTEKALGYC
jgi:hypothetical protein